MRRRPLEQHRWWGGVTLSLVLLTFGATAAANPVASDSSAARGLAPRSREIARQSFARGVSLASEGRFTEARNEFLQAHRMAPHYLVLYNLAQTHVRMQEWSEAATYLRLALRHGASAMDAEFRQRVETELHRLHSLALDEFSSPPSSASRPRVVTARLLDPRSVPLTSTSRVESKPSETNVGARIAHTWAYSALAAGAVGIAASGGLYAWNDGRHDDWQAEDKALRQLQLELLDGGASPRQDPDLRSRASRNDERLASVQRFDAVTLTLAGVATAALLSGVWSLVSASPEKKQPIPRVGVALEPATHAASVGLHGRW